MLDIPIDALFLSFIYIIFANGIVNGNHLAENGCVRVCKCSITQDNSTEEHKFFWIAIRTLFYISTRQRYSILVRVLCGCRFFFSILRFFSSAYKYFFTLLLMCLCVCVYHTAIFSIRLLKSHFCFMHRFLFVCVRFCFWWAALFTAQKKWKK